jgi:hypothetical protein
LFAPLDIFGNFFFNRGLVLFFAEADRYESIVGSWKKSSHFSSRNMCVSPQKTLGTDLKMSEYGFGYIWGDFFTLIWSPWDLNLVPSTFTNAVDGLVIKTFALQILAPEKTICASFMINYIEHVLKFMTWNILPRPSFEKIA